MGWAAHTKVRNEVHSLFFPQILAFRVKALKIDFWRTDKVILHNIEHIHVCPGIIADCLNIKRIWDSFMQPGMHSKRAAELYPYCDYELYTQILSISPFTEILMKQIRRKYLINYYYYLLIYPSVMLGTVQLISHTIAQIFWASSHILWLRVLCREIQKNLAGILKHCSLLIMSWYIHA